MTGSSRTALVSTAVVLLCVSGSGLIAMSSLSGCSGETEQPREEIVRTDTYTTRGVVAMMPDPANPMSELQIRHERIPDFKNAAGEEVGMNAMQMAFPLAPGVSLEGLTVGQPIAFEWRVIYSSNGRRYEITSIEPLPEGTELDLPL